MTTEYKVQYILFDKTKINIPDAYEWLMKNKYKINKIDETATHFRFRQLEISYLTIIGYTIYKTIIVDDTITMVVAYKPTLPFGVPPHSKVEQNAYFLAQPLVSEANV